MYDLLVKNGAVYDGSGAPPYTADVGVSAGRIAAIGRLEEAAAQVIDATGMAVSPGFIDLHTHSDASFLVDPDAQSKVRQGCTLELTGNCGFSYCAPLLGMAQRQAREMWQGYGLDPNRLDWTTFEEYLARLEQAGSTVNQATQVGHGTVRTAVMGFDDRAPTRAEMETMKDLVAQALDAGAMGLSTGLYYAPGSYARTDEVAELAREAARRDKLYSSHIRDESDYSVSLFNAVEEAIAIGRLSAARVQVSHLKCLGRPVWGRAPDLLERIARARQEGLDVAADQYPYTATSTSLSGAIFPRWSQVGGRDVLLESLANQEFRRRLHGGIQDNLDRRGDAERVVIARHRANPELEGLSLAGVARRLGCDPVEAAIRVYQAGEAQVVTHSLEEADVEIIAAGPWVAVGSDGNSLKTEGPLSGGRPHPRSYGTFPRFLARYVREKKVVSLPEAVRKMTLLPAARLGLTQRGRVAPGLWADLVVFDPETVADAATFDNPHRYPVGVRDVVVNGVPVVLAGDYTGARPGKLLRRFAD